MIYMELKTKNIKNMSNIVASGAFITTTIYILIGIFGYATFANNLRQLCYKDILMANYKGSKMIKLGQIGIILSAIAACPIAILPCK